MSADAAALARRWFEEVWNQRRAETVDELLSPTSTCEADGGPLTGPDEFRTRLLEPFLAAFPDVHVTVEDVVSDESRAVVRWTATATHTGPGLGLTPTGRRVTMRGLSWITVEDGRLGLGWQYTNIPDVLRSLATP